MTRRHLMTLTFLLALSDGLAAVLVFVGVSVVRFEADPAAVWSVGVDPQVASLGFAAAWVVVCWWLGLYRLRVRWSLLADARDVLRALVVFAAVTLSVLFVAHQDNVSRVFLALLFVVQPVAALGLRAILRRWFEAIRRRGGDPTYMLVAGTGHLAQEFADEVEAHPSLGIEVIGHLSVPSRAGGVARGGRAAGVEHAVSRPILGPVEQMSDIFRTRVVDEVAVCLAPGSAHYLESVVSMAAEEGKTVRVPRDADEDVLQGALTEDLDGFRVLSVVHDGQREVERALKRLVDLAGASAALLLLSPLWVGTALAVRIRDGGPVIYRQTRIGRNGRPFTMYKFRTMIRDADNQYEDLAKQSFTDGPAFKMLSDPRVTPLGRALRKWSLDELPQLLNVLKGDMSLVGPRPAPQREVEGYDIWHRRRLSVRPGMTGLWQVQARFDEHFDDRAILDLRYIDNWSLWMDLGILARTLPAVLLARGR